MRKEEIRKILCFSVLGFKTFLYASQDTMYGFESSFLMHFNLFENRYVPICNVHFLTICPRLIVT